jgi:hypothetical protein
MTMLHWRNIMVRAGAVLVFVMGGMLLGGCSNKLDKETAEKVLMKEEFSSGTVECTWRVPTLRTAKEWTFGDYDEGRECAAQLVKAGLATEGECLDYGCGGCCRRVISATTKSRLDEKEHGLVFTCGQIKLVGVTSIVTEGNKATVKYDREVTLDSRLLSTLSACKLDKPEEGKKNRERILVRDDAGNWSVR